MIVLHAVVPGRAAGVEANGFLVHRSRDVAVLYDEAVDPPDPGRAAILRHGARIVALAEGGPVLPMRYGTSVAGTDELASISDEHADAWARRLATLEDRCELLVHVATPGAGARHPAMSGREYLRRRIAARQQQDQSLDEVRSLIAPWAAELRTLPDGERVAALVARSDTGTVREAVTTWAGQNPDLDIAVTGPWPPFSFCEELDEG